MLLEVLLESELVPEEVVVVGMLLELVDAELLLEVLLGGEGVAVFTGVGVAVFTG